MAWIIGTAASEFLAGTAEDDFIWGLEGNDRISAGEGHDFVDGGSGDDTLRGFGGDDDLYGGIGNDILEGGGNNDYLDGGSGADTMRGGTGNDTYIVDNTADIADESFGGGIDRVESSVSFTLGSGLENLVLTGSGHINATGNTLNNLLAGNSGNNALVGGDGNDTLYGYAGADSLYGDNGNDFLDGGIGADAMGGGAGDDTYVVDNAGDVVFEWGGDGTDTVQSSISFTLGDTLENLTLTGTAGSGTGNELDNVITGNSGNNTMKGGGGSDTLDGRGGSDTMIGGTGGDTYYADNIGDITFEDLGQGNDRLYSPITWTLADNVEILFLTGSAFINGTGNATDNQIYGNSGNNALAGLDGRDNLEGGAGADTLDGGSGNDWLLGDDGDDVLNGGAGNDTLAGGAGNDLMIGELGDDTYDVNNAGDLVIEAADEGRDLVFSLIDYALGANLEDLQLAGDAISGTGNELDNNLQGSMLDNLLQGGGGNDDLFGRLGADTMIGGAGDDSYDVDDVGDIVTELAGEGWDYVTSSISYVLGANVESVSLVGFTSALSAVGNELDNGLRGNELDNILVGGEGNDQLDGLAGADFMDGGNGNDTYDIDNAGDVVTDTGGIDTIRSSISYTLDPFQIENLSLVFGTGIDGIGNGLDNIIHGNELDNTLVGGTGNDTLVGSAGNDSLYGGDDNDTYRFVELSDFVFEAANQGTDTIISHISFTLPDNFEVLSLWEWGGSLNGTGNNLNNVLLGNFSANVLDGRGGADVLQGGAGADRFVFSDVSHSQPGALDQITDFSGAEGDRIDLTLIDANTILAGDQAFVFLGAATFTGAAGQLRLDGFMVEGDVNGDAAADFALAVFGSSPAAGDFLL